jgi:hypothetical protein
VRKVAGGRAVGAEAVLLEGDAFVAGLDGGAEADEPVATPDGGGDVGEFVAAGFAFAGGAAEALEGLEEEGLDVVGLELAGFGAFHVVADARDVAGVHGVDREDAVLDEVLEVRSVDGVVDGALEAGADVGAVAVADGFDEQVAQRLAVELELAEDVEDLPAEGVAGGFELLEQAVVDVAFAGLVGDEVPEVADLGLADAVDAAEALLEPVGVPRQVVVDHQVRALEVDAFAGGVGGEQHLDVWVVAERLLGVEARFASHAAVDGDERSGVPSTVLMRC